MSRDIFHQTRLLRALSNLAFNTAREEAATASLGSNCLKQGKEPKTPLAREQVAALAKHCPRGS